MKCWNCDQGETINFSHLCQRCTNYYKAKERQEEESVKTRRYKGMIYADECSTCHTTTKTVWLVTFKNTLGKLHGKMTGAWCEDCIYKMVGQKQITSVLDFKDIKDVQFIKKLRDPFVDKASLDVCDVLKSVDF